MKSSLLALLGSASSALAAVRGFNYASQGQDYNGFASQFKTAASLVGANDFTSARLYTMIQDGTTNTPISAIQAAIDTKTTLLLGLWASVPQDAFNNEITALKSAIQQYGSDFADLVTGISVGSEDLYRISPTGIAAGSDAGQSPDVLVDYIGQVRDAIKGTSLGSKPVGHVDTWNVYVNSSNSEVISACDFLGLDEYPYFQTTDTNDIDNASFLFFQAYDRVAAVAGGKPIWITESGWPVSGPTTNLAVPSTKNAETYWQDVACELQSRQINLWWYILADAGASPSFGLSENGTPLYNLACNATAKSSSNSTSAGSHSASASSGSAGPHGTTYASGTKPTTAVVTAQSTGGAAGATYAPTTAGATQAQHTAVSATSSGVGSQYTGAASKIETSVAGIVVGAVLAALAL